MDIPGVVWDILFGMGWGVAIVYWQAYRRQRRLTQVYRDELDGRRNMASIARIFKDAS